MVSHPDSDEARMEHDAIDGNVKDSAAVDEAIGKEWDYEFKVPDTEPMVNEGDEIREIKELMKDGLQFLWNELLKEKKINGRQDAQLSKQAVNMFFQDLEIKKLERLVESYQAPEEVFERTVKPENAKRVISSDDIDDDDGVEEADVEKDAGDEVHKDGDDEVLSDNASRVESNEKEDEVMPKPTIKTTQGRKKRLARKNIKPIQNSTSSSHKTFLLINHHHLAQLKHHNLPKPKLKHHNLPKHHLKHHNQPKHQLKL